MRNEKQLKALEDFNKQHGETFCIKPFTEVASTPLGGVKLCCYSGAVDYKTEYFSDKNSLQKTFDTNKGLLTSRKALLSGKKIPACQACWKDEKAGNKSMRMDHTEYFKQEDPQFVKDIKDYGRTAIKSIDVKFGNKCNYACIMCAPDNSSLWGKEIKKNPVDKDLFHGEFNDATALVDYPEYKYKELLEVSKNVIRVKSTGGEPLLLDGFKDYIKKLVEKGYAKNITFTTVTNGTIDCSDLLEYMNEFKKFKMNWSVDGTDEVYNYVRWPGNFDRMRRVHEKLASEIINKKYENIEVSMHPTIQLFNVHNIPQMIQYAKDLQIVEYVDFGYIFDDPKYFNTGVLPDDMLEDIIKQNTEIVDKIETNNKFEHTHDNIISTMRRDQIVYNEKHDKKELFNQAKRMVEWFEKTRKLDIYKHISTYKQLESHYR